ncbi:MAG: PepSY-associated TM helix domain-containing protein [Pseudomonadota bacterium]
MAMAHGGSRSRPDQVAVRRWHFHAGLFCLPFCVWLALTGTLPLFRPGIEDWLDRPYENLRLSGPRAAPSAEAQAAEAAVPGSTFSHYQPPLTATGAAQVLVVRKGVLYRVYVEPATLRAMKVIEDGQRPMNLVAHLLAPLHGRLLPGPGGSRAVETATQGAPGWPAAPSFSDVCSAEPAAYLRALDKLVPLAARLRPPRPIWISPPATVEDDWTVSSQTQDQPLRVTYRVDAGRAVVTGIRRFGNP